MCIRICLGFRDLVGMTLRDFKYQPHVTGGSKCLKNILQHDIATCFCVFKYFSTISPNMFCLDCHTLEF